MLKKFVGSNCKVQTNLPELDEEGSIWLQPKAVMDTKERQLRQHTIKGVLIQWKDMQPKNATWDQVFLHLQPYKHTSPKDKVTQKPTPKFYGPYQIIQHIGQVAYKMAFPTHSKIHPVFHVSCLKKFLGSNCKVRTNLP
jgi:hypothetical protein